MRALLTVWVAWLTLMAGANLATPLYAVYARHFHFSSLVLTAVFATYAFTLVLALVLFGRLSDRFGRRPVILAGLAVSCVGLALFAAAHGTAWLFGARALQGLAVGMVSGTATAALVELDPGSGRPRAAMLAGLAQAGGSAAGPLLAGVLAEWAPDRLRLCYLVTLAVTFVAAVFVARLPDAEEAAGDRWRIQWPRVPAESRSGFVRVALTAAVVWATLALFLSLVPSYAGELLRTSNLALLAVLAAIALAASCCTQIVAQRMHGSPRRDQALGLGLLAVGLVAVVLAAPLRSVALLAGAAAVAGAGHGLAFLNAQQELNELAPEERRGEVTSAFVACIYVLVAGAVIAAGLLDLRFSLSVAVGAVSVALVVVAVVAAAWQIAVLSPARGRAPRRRAAARRYGAAPR
jgi:predicted MFS family arabinose efflux permease